MYEFCEKNRIKFMEEAYEDRFSWFESTRRKKYKQYLQYVEQELRLIGKNSLRTMIKNKEFERTNSRPRHIEEQENNC